MLGTRLHGIECDNYKVFIETLKPIANKSKSKEIKDPSIAVAQKTEQNISFKAT